MQTRDLEGGSTPPSRPKSVVAGETLASAANHLAHTGVSKAPPATIDRWQPIFKPRYDEVMVWYLLQDDVGAGIPTSALIVRIFRPATGRHPIFTKPHRRACRMEEGASATGIVSSALRLDGRARDLFIYICQYKLMRMIATKVVDSKMMTQDVSEELESGWS